MDKKNDNIITSDKWDYGWVCPKCGRIYAPTHKQCFYCSNDSDDSETKEQVETEDKTEIIFS